MVEREQWTTREEIAAARHRFQAALPGWQRPIAYGVASASTTAIEYPVVNVDAHGLPALVLASVCGHRSGSGTYRLTHDDLTRAVELLTPAEACLDYDHPNLRAWRALLEQSPPGLAAVFLGNADKDTHDAYQHRLSVLAQTVELPTDLGGGQARALVATLDAATEALVAAVRGAVASLALPSLLPGWSRVNVVAHVRYVAEAMVRITMAALNDEDEDMYPGGRAETRPATLVLRPDETIAALVDSLAASAADLSALWNGLSVADWNRRLVDRDHGEMTLSRLLALRLTEVEVHAADLGIEGLSGWSDAFVEAVLPLRIAWLHGARHRSDADLTLNGSWVLTDDDATWLVRTDGPEVIVGSVAPARSADCRLTAPKRDLLALLLGRPTASARAVGIPELATGFKAAFPGP